MSALFPLLSTSALSTSALSTSALAQLTDQRTLWYLMRGTGIVVVALLTAATALGVLSTVRPASAWWPRFATQRLHRNVSLIAVTLLVVHVLTAVFHSYVSIGWLDVVVPFSGSYRPFWVGLGALAVDALLIVTVTSLLRHRMGHRSWRGTHLLAYLAWVFGVAHGLGIGTDARSPWAFDMTVLCIAVVCLAAATRLVTLAHDRRIRVSPRPAEHVRRRGVRV